MRVARHAYFSAEKSLCSGRHPAQGSATLTPSMSFLISNRKTQFLLHFVHFSAMLVGCGVLSVKGEYGGHIQLSTSYPHICFAGLSCRIYNVSKFSTVEKSAALDLGVIVLIAQHYET